MLSSARVLRVDAQTPDPAFIAQAAGIIRGGGLVAFPTETVYGLGANAWDAAAVDRIFRAKSRPASDPLIVHIAEMAQLPQVARDVPAAVDLLCRRFFPGALTLVLRKSARIPDNLSAGMNTVALRMPDHAVARALIKAAGLPIAAPSANTFSRPSPTRAAHVLDDLADKVDLLLDGGSTRIGVESTIISLVDKPPRLLRPGGISLEALRALLPDLQYTPLFATEADVAVPAPGTLLKHYSPRARLLLFRGDDAAVYAAMRAEIARHKGVGLLLRQRDLEQFADLDMPSENLGENSEQAAERLFAGLRALDKAGAAVILARAPEQIGLGLALHDRLLRAAVGEVVNV
ncbi:MAG: L-threonylcarbamoyladenylate synthase [Chloroflexi bacterium]|nr:L-threonylcarbamoyladenylate synthase [Chloroflexota bacterium]MCY4247596.1 L-threonylcarbamoyladenylate synthase [Chloroflexota bacterium]